MADAHVLVTGAAGLVGAAACRSLDQAGVPYTALWHRVEPSAPRKFRADLSRPNVMAAISGVTAIVHAVPLCRRRS